MKMLASLVKSQHQIKDNMENFTQYNQVKIFVIIPNKDDNIHKNEDLKSEGRTNEQ